MIYAEAREAAAARYAEKAQAKAAHGRPRYLCEWLNRCEFAKVDDHHCNKHRGRPSVLPEPPKRGRPPTPREPVPEVAPGLRWCAGHKEAHPLGAFAKGSHGRDGWQNSCRAHARKMRTGGTYV